MKPEAVANELEKVYHQKQQATGKENLVVRQMKVAQNDFRTPKRRSFTENLKLKV